MKSLESFLTPSQSDLFDILLTLFSGNALYSKGNFILVKGVAPILLVAHLDTVHENPIKDICTSADGNILISPQGIGGDDRCGVYALVNAYERSPVKPYLLFTCDEETGGLGAKSFLHCLNQLPTALSSLKCIVEIDRKGNNDAVFYQCDNPDFKAFINSKGFTTATGSFSDISVIAPALGVAAVNLSCGYYNAHTLHEFINRKELDSTLTKVLDIVADSSRKDFPHFAYIEKNPVPSFYNLDDDFDVLSIPNDLPIEFHECYVALLDIYPVEQLED